MKTTKGVVPPQRKGPEEKTFPAVSLIVHGRGQEHRVNSKGEEGEEDKLV